MKKTLSPVIYYAYFSFWSQDYANAKILWILPKLREKNANRLLWRQSFCYYSSDNDFHCLKCLSQCVTDCICIARQARLCHTLSLLAWDPSYRASVGQFLSLRAHHRGRRRSANHKKSDLLPPSRSLCHFFLSHLPHSKWMTLPFFWGIVQEIGSNLAEALVSK